MSVRSHSAKVSTRPSTAYGEKQTSSSATPEQHGRKQKKASEPSQAQQTIEGVYDMHATCQ